MVGKLRKIIIFICLMGLSACVSIDKTPPKQVANACLILDEKDKWKKPIFQSSYEWGISPGSILAIMRQESGFRRDARPVDKNGNKLSSAHGYSQALDGTWASYEKARGQGKRNRFDDAADFIGWYGDQIARQTNISKSDTKSVYLAFHEGPTGYKRGTYYNKTWLINVADKVAANARNYDNQLFDCEKGRMKKFTRLADN